MGSSKGEANKVQVPQLKANSSGGTNEQVADAVCRFGQSLKKDGPLRILELGAGNGHLALLVQARLKEQDIAFEYLCTDIDTELLKDVDGLLDCRFLDVQGPFEVEGPFDVVVAVEIIEHIENPFHCIREVAGVLAPGGLFVMTSPNTLSLSSRLRFLFTGRYDYFRRPYDEHHLNMGHMSPVSAILATYVLRKNGMELHRVSCNRWRLLSNLLYLPLIPLIAFWTWFHFVFRERGKAQRERNRELMARVLHPDLLFGKVAIYEARRTGDFVASRDGWYRADERFPA